MTLDVTRRPWQCPGGGGQYNYSIVDEAPIILRASADGTIANAEDLIDDKVLDGIINIDKCPGILFMLSITWGSLDAVGFRFEFGTRITPSTILWFKPLANTGGEAAGVCVLEKFSYNILDTSANEKFCWFVPNPGAQFIRCYISSTGTVTSSAALIYINRLFYTPSDYNQNVL